MDKVKPVIVLALIAALISGLVIVVYNATYVDTSNIVTDKQAAAVIQIYGGKNDDYEVVPAEKWQDMFSEGDLSKITKVIKNKDGSLAFEAVVKGYKNGYDIMVGVKDGKVAGVSVVSVGEETPGLGTKTNDPEDPEGFLHSFTGKSGNVVIVKNKNKDDLADNEVNGVTSATFSSKGVASAVNIALKAYEKCGGEFK